MAVEPAREQARAQIAKTEAIIAQKRIRAPFDGRLGVRQIELGQFLSQGTPIVTLTDLHHLYVNFTLPSTMRAQIALGQKVDGIDNDRFARRQVDEHVSERRRRRIEQLMQFVTHRALRFKVLRRLR